MWISASLVLALAAGSSPDSTGPAKAGEEAPVTQRGAEVSGSRSDASPPLREIPPAPRREGKRVHEVKPLPRPPPPGKDPAPAK